MHMGYPDPGDGQYTNKLEYKYTEIDVGSGIIMANCKWSIRIMCNKLVLLVCQ